MEVSNSFSKEPHHPIMSYGIPRLPNPILYLTSHIFLNCDFSIENPELYSGPSPRPVYVPNFIGNMEIIGITVVSIVSEQAAYKAELEQLSQERRFSPRKALERKAETEARYFFLQRVYDDSARLEIMLDIYAGWVGRMSTPRGLAEFVLKDYDDGLMG
jgi:hypothetical protein